jgi:5-methylcytosine-specific restriction endonuclease McrA
MIPVAVGGATAIENLQLLCSYCNQAKGRPYDASLAGEESREGQPDDRQTLLTDEYVFDALMR